MRGALLFLPILFLVGCHGRSESDLIGNWTSSKGSAFAIASKGVYTAMGKGRTRMVPESGVWTMAGNRVTLTLTTVDGTPVADLKARLRARSAALAPRVRAALAIVGEPETFEFSDDGKTLSKVSPPTKTPYTLTKG